MKGEGKHEKEINSFSCGIGIGGMYGSWSNPSLAYCENIISNKHIHLW